MNDTAPRKPRRITRRRVLYALATFLIAAIAIVSLLPLAIKAGIERTLRNQGHERATVENVDFNPFTATLTVRGLSGGEDNEAFLQAGHVHLVLDWFALFDRNVLIKTVIVEDVALHIRLDESGQWHVGKIAIASSAPPEATSEPFELPVGLGADAVTLRNVRLLFDHPLAHADLIVEHGTVSELRSWTVENPAPFDVEMSVNGAPVHFSGETTPFDETATLDVKIAMEAFPLESLDALAADAGAEDLVGRIDAEIEATLALQFADRTVEAQTDGSIALNAIGAAYESYQISASALRWDGTTQLSGGFESPDIETKGTLEVAELKLAEAEDLSAEAGAIRWEGAAIVTPGSPLVVATSGGLAGQAIFIKGSPDTIDQASVESLQFDMEDLAVTSADSTRVTANNIRGIFEGIAASNPNPQVPEASLAKLEAAFNNVQIELAESNIDLRAGADVSATSIEVVHTGVVPAEAAIELVNVELDVGISGDPNDTPDIALKGNANVSGIIFHNKETALDVAQLQKAEFNGIDISAVDEIQIESTKLENTRLLQRTQQERDAESAYIATLESLAVDRIALSKYRAELERIQLNGLSAYLVIEESGQRELAKLVEPFEPAQEAANAEPASDTPPPMERPISEPGFSFHAKLVEIGGDSTILLEDRKVSPAAQLGVSRLNVAVRELDTANPELLIPVNLDASLGDASRLRIDGKASLLAHQPTVDAQLQLDALSLPEFTGYTQRTIGYRIDSGTLDLETNANIDEAQLDTTNTLLLSRLALTKLDEQELTEFDNQLGMPVNAAVNLLRDGDGSIELTIPVEGDLDNPEFKIGPVVRKALGNAMKKSVLAVLTPLRILGIGKDDAPLNEALAFKAVPFENGSSALDNEATKYLDEVASILKKHPGLTLRLSGIADSSEIETGLASEDPETGAKATPPPLVPAGEAQRFVPLKERLMELANERANVVQSYLLETGGVDPDQLLIEDSSATVGESESHPPSVAIGL